MKSIFGAVKVCAALFCVATCQVACAVDYQTALNNLARASNKFVVDNLAETWVSTAAEQSLEESITLLSSYVHAELEKPRSFGQGISANNKALILAGLKKAVALSEKLIKTANDIRTNSAYFAKENYANLLPHLQGITNRVQALVNETQDVKHLQGSLKPAFGDVEDTKKMKDAVSRALGAMEALIEKFFKDWAQLNNKIKAAVQLEEQKARDKQLGKIK